jgi:putative ABC transport system permease protein
MHALWNDVRLAARRLVREPIFAVTAVLTLAVGIAANTAIFTLVNGILLRPLPYSAADELVLAHAVLRGDNYEVFSGPVFLALREEGRTFSDVAMFGHASATLAAGGGEPEQVQGGVISANYFDLVGVPPLHGRVFRAEENEPSAGKVVLLSEGVWRDRFGADETIVGRTVEISGLAREVVGIMPARASFPPQWQFWVPQQFTADFRDPTNVLALGYNVVARLRPGVTTEQASAEAARIVELAKAAGGMDNPAYTGAVTPLHDYYVDHARAPLLLLFGAVGLVLLIVCANIANLLLAQAAARSTDFAVRVSLGASSGQLLRQVMTESMVLGLVGGVAGLLLGMWAADAIIASLPADVFVMPGVAIDARVMLFTFATSLVAAILFGLAPALQARRGALSAALREGGRGLAGRAGGRTRAGLVLAESALAFALVIGAGLLLRSLGELRSVDPGFEPDNALVFQIGLPVVRYDSEERRVAFWDQLTERLEAVPGVSRVGAIQHLPLGGNAMQITFEVEGNPASAPGEEPAIQVRIVTPGYFDAMQIPLRRGRAFADSDRSGSTPVALLSESAAARHFPGEDPMGRRIMMDWSTEDGPVTGEVVGIVGDVRHGRLRTAAAPEIYFPQAQLPRVAMTFTLRTATAPMALARPVTDAVHELDPGLAVAQLRPLTDVVASSVETDRFMARLIAAFGAIALLLAAIGIFGVISYGVAQRRREIGVRMAVGATRGDVLRLIVAGALRLAGAGIILGALAGLALGRAMQSLLFGVAPFDPATFVIGGAVLVAVAVLASVVPALNAARTPPAIVLNAD